MIYVLFVLGFIVLVKGADLLVDGASSIGKKFKLSSLIIGEMMPLKGATLRHCSMRTKSFW